MERNQKPKEVAALKERFEKAKSVIFIKNKGLKVSEVTFLRKTLNKEAATLKMVKNRLLKRALKEAKIEGLDALIDGSITVASSEVDAVKPAKILVDFAKENERLEIKGGYLAGEILSIAKIKHLAQLPSKEVLLAKLLGCLQNPATHLVNVLAAVPRGLVTVLDGIRKTKEK